MVSDPLHMGHVILRMRSSRVRIFNGNQREITFIVEPPNITVWFGYLNRGVSR